MNARVDRATFTAAIPPVDAGKVTMCPNCGSTECASNLINEAPFRQAARGASMLRQFGHAGAAANVLHSLASVQISNFLRPKWLCLICGVAYVD